MANTRSATLSLRLKPEAQKRLAKLAKTSGRSSNFLISDAVECYVADQERMLAEKRQADRQVKSGHYVRHEDIVRLRSSGAKAKAFGSGARLRRSSVNSANSR